MTTATTPIPATLADALAQGYHIYRYAWERGYISRKADPLAARVYRGRKGLYVCLADARSTQYIHRAYLAPNA